LIYGGESGPDAGFMKADWARDVRDYCAKGGDLLDGKLWRKFPELGRAA
jgi:hypothetical protein